MSLPEYTLTHYDVKLLMKSYRETLNKENRMASSFGSELEDEIMDQVRGQFTASRAALKSTTSNASEDSGIDDTPHSPRLSIDDLPTLPSYGVIIEQTTPVANTPVTPLVIPELAFTAPADEIPLEEVAAVVVTKSDIITPNGDIIMTEIDEIIRPKRRFLPKRLFGKKKRNLERRRTKSLGAQEIQASKGERPAPLFGSSLLNREWELVTVREMCRRLSLDEIEQLEMPIPEGASQSQILDELMIRQIMEILPPRAEGYPWVSIYNSEKHGFSLTTLYRKMIEFDEDLSPVLLIVRDTREHVFGAVVSGAIRPSDHYTGTGDSCLLWRFLGEAPHTRDLRHYGWTGDNQFFVNAAKDSLSIGAGGGHYGLWLDADLNHGRSQRCDTFGNEPLAGEKEDFIVQFIEAFGFRM
ncbi:hypothetical protein RB195_013610 [Necator americanus]